MNWTLEKKELPKLNEEYLVAVDFEDGQEGLCVFAAEFNVADKKWFWSNTTEEVQGKVIFWSEKPDAPVVSWKKKIFAEALTVDEMERRVYGQCRHGENMASCKRCNHSDNAYFVIDNF